MSGPMSDLDFQLKVVKEAVTVEMATAEATATVALEVVRETAQAWVALRDVVVRVVWTWMRKR